MVMIQQLRIYEIFEKNKAAFHTRFRDHAARIMQTRYGFRIVAMWETKFGDRTEFAYLLEWPNEATKTAAWSAFMADTEWSEIKRVTHAEHGLMVGQIEDRVLTPTDYSPKGRNLLATSAQDTSLVSRTRCSVQRCSAEPGPKRLAKPACLYTASTR